MEVKLQCRKENKETYISMLEAAGFVITDTAHLTFKEDDYVSDTFIAKKGEATVLVAYQEVVFIESFGNQIHLHTLRDTLEIKERLYEIAGMYEDKGFIRINKSQIVNKAMIQEIRPQINSKFTLVMKNKAKIDVTRSYLLQFKEAIGL